MSSTYLCNGCMKLASQMGSRVRMLDGRPQRVCASCAPTLEAGKRSKKAKKPEINLGFTTGKYGVPLGTKDYVGYDFRFQASPEEANAIKANGFYAKQWRELRSKK
jgi:hypothetical protein